MVITVPAWMLDPVVCAGMVVGEPRVNLEALDRPKQTTGGPRNQAILYRRCHRREGGLEWNRASASLRLTN